MGPMPSGSVEKAAASAREELLYYFGPELVAELDALEAATAGAPREPERACYSAPFLLERAGQAEPDLVMLSTHAITGYNPKTGANDNGAVEIDVLNYWRQSGIAGHKIAAYMALEPSNHTHIMDSVYIFEGCYIGLQLPVSAQDQVKNHQPWSVPPGGAIGDGKPGKQQHRHVSVVPGHIWFVLFLGRRERRARRDTSQHHGQRDSHIR